jgi:hypothetical protein
MDEEFALKCLICPEGSGYFVCKTTNPLEAISAHLAGHGLGMGAYHVGGAEGGRQVVQAPAVLVTGRFCEKCPASERRPRFQLGVHFMADHGDVPGRVMDYVSGGRCVFCCAKIPEYQVRSLTHSGS